MTTLDVNNGALFVALCPAQTLDQYRELKEKGTIIKEGMDRLELFDVAPHIAWNAYWHSPVRSDPTVASVVDKAWHFLLANE